MATDVLPTKLLDVHDLPIEEIAKLPTIDLSRILPEQPRKRRRFQSEI